MHVLLEALLGSSKCETKQKHSNSKNRLCLHSLASFLISKTTGPHLNRQGQHMRGARWAADSG